MLLSSHLLDEVEKTCDVAAIVDNGRVVAQGTIAELTAGATREIDIVAAPTRARRGRARRRARRGPRGRARRRHPRDARARGAARPRDRHRAAAPAARPTASRSSASRRSPRSLEDLFLTMTTRLEDAMHDLRLIRSRDPQAAPPPRHGRGRAPCSPFVAVAVYYVVQRACRAATPAAPALRRRDRRPRHGRLGRRRDRRRDRRRRRHRGRRVPRPRRHRPLAHSRCSSPACPARGRSSLPHRSRSPSRSPPCSRRARRADAGADAATSSPAPPQVLAAGALTAAVCVGLAALTGSRGTVIGARARLPARRLAAARADRGARRRALRRSRRSRSPASAAPTSCRVRARRRDRDRARLGRRRPRRPALWRTRTQEI